MVLGDLARTVFDEIRDGWNERRIAIVAKRYDELYRKWHGGDNENDHEVGTYLRIAALASLLRYMPPSQDVDTEEELLNLFHKGHPACLSPADFRNFVQALARNEKNHVHQRISNALAPDGVIERLVKEQLGELSSDESILCRRIIQDLRRLVRA